MLNVTVDTNVIVSSVIRQGNPYCIAMLAKQKLIKLCVSLPLLQELSVVLQRSKFGFSKYEVEKIIEELLSASDIVTPTKIIKELDVDPTDNKVLECAVASNSDYIISGDHHLLDLKEYDGAKIVTAHQFLELFSSLSRTS